MQIQVEGLEELRARFAQFPNKFNAELKDTLWDSLNIVWEKVLPYPPKSESSTYIRTGTLGRSLGSSESGGRASGSPSIYQVKSQGPKVMFGEFGTNVEYAPYVIGDKEQIRIHKRNGWWTLVQIGERAKPKIQQAFESMARGLATWLDGKRL